MTERFLSYIKKHTLFSEENKILLAVSGGADSVTMAHLFYKSEINAAIAHCNFQLRGEESTDDEKFVRDLAEQFGMPFFVKHFNTHEYAELQKISIQMAARELRYNWFENLRKLNGYNFIATAHNADDAIETFFINLLRGCGIQGLTGIRAKNGFLVRPLLFAFRHEIEEYCSINNLHFRTDSSNASDKYLRNKIRHSVIPLLENINPEFKPVMIENFTHLNDTEKIYLNFIQDTISDVITKNDGYINVSIQKLKDSVAPKTVLYEILKGYGFTPKTAAEIYNNIDGESGSIYLSDNYRLIKDRMNLIITLLNQQSKKSHFYIEENKTELSEPVILKIEKFNSEGYQIKKHPDICAVDVEKLSFPLILRHWQSGDYFQPLGMTGMKKLSDFFVDLKLSVAQKENTWILTSGDKIVWVVGMRPDDHFKITPNTKNILQISLMR